MGTAECRARLGRAGDPRPAAVETVERAAMVEEMGPARGEAAVRTTTRPPERMPRAMRNGPTAPQTGIAVEQGRAPKVALAVWLRLQARRMTTRIYL
jgi:hypothetical protein